MSFHKKALIAFLLFHAVFTVGALIIGFSQTVPEPTNDQDMIIEGVWPYVVVLFLLALSLVVLAVAYLKWGIVKLVKRLQNPHGTCQ